ncbi:Pr6Pr family membrane protein [Cryobacterium sp. MLB-32]|uniref:Pr6Pr family membrane protein n=1 Tax=Cryobacterium sp. MLB-32 TaxID=1529318 RepID=UPI00068DED08|nr:Pr6Pr family membrane protein [Cryobacterium sp. MLB-32]
MASLGILALTGYFVYTLGVASFAIVNFFSYFTVQSAIAAILVLIMAGVMAVRQPRDPAWLDMARAMITTYILVSGVVYAIIVMQSAGANYSIAVPWSSQILHFWIPTLALADWIIDPFKARVPWRYLGWVIVFPVLWLVFTLVRGPIAGWYPYFFLDSRQVSGPTETVFYCAIIVVIITGISALLIALTRIDRMPRHRQPLWGATPDGAAPEAAAHGRPGADDAELLRDAERLERAKG